MRTSIVATAISAMLLSNAVVAKPWKEPPTGSQAIPYNRVSEAFATLSKLEGAVVSGNEERGFLINEANKRTQWSFTSFKDPAHPAVVRRTVRTNPDERSEVAILCEKKSAACQKLLVRFKSIDDLAGLPIMDIKPKASAAE